MRLPRVGVRVTHAFDHAPDTVYAWMTDYREDDPARAGSVVRGRVIRERSPTRVVLEETLEIAGVTGRGVFEVHLDPERRRWTASIIQGAGRGSFHTYTVKPAPGGCRLVVRYGIRTRRLKTFVRLWFAKPRLRREFERMWEGFARAMEGEIGREA